MSLPRGHLLMHPGRPTEARELCVVVACHQLVCAIATRWVERLVLPDEVASIAPATSPAGSLVLVGEKPYAAWNLGHLLGVAPLEAAWVLLRVLHKGELLPVALHTGPCVVVQQLAPGVTLPAGAFRSRAGALASAVTSTAINGRVIGSVALWLDPARLWSSDELDGAAAALRTTGQGRS